MIVSEKLYNAGEFFEFARQPENQERRLELVNGVIVEMPPSRPINTIIAIRIAHFLSEHVMTYDNGYVTGADGGYKLSENQVRQPDAAFISKDRYPTVPDEFDGAPDIAVEVVSPREDALGKASDYLKAGTSQVWAIYPDTKTVHVLQKTEPRWTELTIGDVLHGGDVLPDFELAVEAIFPE
jgi:Uma2 family endonuclease